MNKTLTALVMTGALALSACDSPIYTSDAHTKYGEHIRQRNGNTFTIIVTDQENRRSSGILPRRVRLSVSGTAYTSPYTIIGDMENALVPNATFTSGSVEYKDDPLGNCSWGPKVADRDRCTAAQVANAQKFLSDAYVEVVAK
jgi:hypothetical protein